MLLMLAILIPLKHLFPEAISEALIEVGCEEALRKNSHCATEESALIPGGDILRRNAGV